MSPPIKTDVSVRKFIENTSQPWINSVDLKNICSTFDEVEKATPEGPADFEKAITLTGYGKFNYLLLLAILPAGWASIYSSTSMSYVLSSAECDLNLTLFDKGLLNSMPFAGMVVTAFIWGFLTDTYGRKKILTWGYLTTAIISLASSLSHASWLLILFKFLHGIVISGPYTALMSYLAEVHGEQQRSRIYMWLGVFFSLGYISMPCLAWLVIPNHWNLVLFGVHFTSWRIFLVLCAIPEISAFFAISFFPESPRFLLTTGRNAEALEIFRQIYSLNTGNDAKTYALDRIDREKALLATVERTDYLCALFLLWLGLPIWISIKGILGWVAILTCFLTIIFYQVTTLSDEDIINDHGKSLMQRVNGGFRQMLPLFKTPYIIRLMLISAIQFGGTVGSNTLRLWMPQLFSMIETYEQSHPVATSGPYPSICVMLAATNTSSHTINAYVNHTMTIETVCAPAVVNSTVYLNSMVIALTGVVGYTIAGSLITCAGTKKLMVFCFLTAGCCCGILYWAEDSNGILGISSVFVALSSIGGAAVTNIIVDNFPTSLRAMAISVTMMFGRFGAVGGNLLFPVLFKLSCLGPFFMIGIACIVCSVLVMFVPSPTSKFKESIRLNAK